jgi:TatA/E family protein of Tat protein translocase
VPLLLILDSLGTSELLVILAVALIFFGPRKLPQISRQIGKSLAEFRKASDEFKSTWAREVALESESQADSWQPTSHSSAVGAVEPGAPANTIAAGQEIAQPNEITPEVNVDSADETHLSAVTESAPVVPAAKSDWL